MTRINLLGYEPCPKCGAKPIEGFDGANDEPYELCLAVEYRPPRRPKRCDFSSQPLRWIKRALEAIA